MSRYFDWPASLKRFLRGDTARAEDVNDALDQVSAGLDSLEQDVDRSVKGPVGESLELNFAAALRAGKVLAFDALGAPIVITAGWRCTGTDGAYSGTVYSTCSFTQEGDTFTPYADLTQEQVLGWCWAAGVNKEATEAAVAGQIENQKNPPVIQPPLPWLQGAAA